MESERFDITKIYPELYNAKSKEVALIEVPVLRTLSVTGQGDTNGPRFQNSVQALYEVAGALQNISDDSFVPDGFVDFAIPPLESLWSMKDGKPFDVSRKEDWLWEVFLVVPGFVTQTLVKKAVTNLGKNEAHSVYHQIHITTLEEKQAVQTLHIGSYENEAKDLELMRKQMEKHGLKPESRHHEIYLNNPMEVATSRLRTILRQPVVPAKNFV